MRKWYGVFELYERMNLTTTKKVELDLPEDEAPGVILDLLSYAARFGVDDAKAEYKAWLEEGKPDSATFFDGSADEIGQLPGGAGFWKMTEEWNGGIGPTPADAAMAFVESMP